MNVKTYGNKIAIFEEHSIRKVWSDTEDDWFYSVVDICGALTNQPTQDRARNYWKVLKIRLKAEGSELVTFCNQLKFRAEDGKMRETDVLNTAGILRLVQSIPSPKAEPFKVWLAQTGYERMEEIADPEKAILRGTEYYRKKGYTEEWIRKRMSGINIRKALTKEWENCGISEKKDFALLTNEITRAWSGMRVKDYKDLKGISPKSNLRDNMTDIEIVLTDVAEVTTTHISQQESPRTIKEHIRVAQRGGGVARVTREAYEKELGIEVVSSLNATDKKALEVKKKQGRTQ